MSTASELDISAGPSDTAVFTYREAITGALVDAMAEDSSTVFLGEDVAAAGGAFKTSKGILERFGPARVLDTPICENTFLGAALGMAVTGLRPVVEIMFSDFLPTAADSIVNEIPNFRFMSGGQLKVPLTIRSIGGGTGGFGTQHSATGESWFLQVPGLRIATLGTPQAAYSVLRAAIRDDNPTLVIEHKAMYGIKGPVARTEHALSPIGRAEILREGGDLTIVATLLMVQRALAAAEVLAAQGIEAEVVDLRWISPMDYKTVEESVQRTGRLLIAEEQRHAGGWGATLISHVCRQGLSLRSQPATVSMPELPVPFSPPLEDEVIPSVARIVDAGLILAGRTDTEG